jgi:hypothetical protein
VISEEVVEIGLGVHFSQKNDAPLPKNKRRPLKNKQL